jgi:hypothetical protein
MGIYLNGYNAQEAYRNNHSSAVDFKYGDDFGRKPSRRKHSSSPNFARFIKRQERRDWRRLRKAEISEQLCEMLLPEPPAPKEILPEERLGLNPFQQGVITKAGFVASRYDWEEYYEEDKGHYFSGPTSEAYAYEALVYAKRS